MDLPMACENWAFSSERCKTRSIVGYFLDPIEVSLGWFPVADHAEVSRALCRGPGYADMGCGTAGQRW